jgi:hypothetical protein
MIQGQDPLRIACDMFIVSANTSDWKSGDYKMIREYVKTIPTGLRSRAMPLTADDLKVIT